MIDQKPRLAWIILLISFSICLGLVILVPVGASTYLKQANRRLDLTLQANQGTVGIIQPATGTGALFAGDQPFALDEGSSILTNATDTAVLLANFPASEDLIARVLIYGNSSLRIEQASTSRFDTSSARHQVIMDLDSGRLQLNIPGPLSRPLAVSVKLPQGSIEIDEAGRYSIEASNASSQVSVLEGAARVSGARDALEIVSDQRSVLDADGNITGPLGTERNLIVNGDFSERLESWAVLASFVEREGQPPVEIKVEEIANEPALIFRRVGIGHADSGIRQVINQDVLDYTNLQLAVSARIQEQSLQVCGELGSECPLMMRIDFEDANGVNRSWIQGLFAVGVPGTSTPDVCSTCPPPLIEHRRIPFQQPAFYESGNLIDMLQQLGMLPRIIKSITIIASGHTFNTEVVDIELTASE